MGEKLGVMIIMISISNFVMNVVVIIKEVSLIL